MSTQKAVIVTQPKTAGLVSSRAIPKLRDDYVLVKTVSVGLNPSDWKHIDFLSPPGVLLGGDYSGVVEAVGKDVKLPWKKGDRICGSTHGGNAVQSEDGSFAEYIVVKGDVQLRIPEHLSFQEAATLGAGIQTVGTLAIQFAKLSGYQVFTTCSPHNFDLVRSLGADAVFDYNDPDSAAQIQKQTNNSLKLVLDCISLPPSVAFADKALSTEGGEYLSLLPANIERANVNSRFILVYTSLGEAFSFGDMPFPAKPEDFEHAKKFTQVAQALLDLGKVKVHPPKVGKDGLRGVLEGVELLRTNKVSGAKLVYNVAETP
ncbi:hypothetical protein ASPVEDRAFT_60099 [Aspergillus versicolor CBS 583.65]|uniref:Enoyl reductase (ER) domain-containing protein n=1 Tax=Aspergillus versicolor CBS 583.65 TaxID=1036611 RepID=A0A1L9PBJ3_ASPVE|nr:uncharacterized protein ASPVEDRAFT_60099 [Aspergillus versicolor CBS 583.65]OJI98878.1 hypothetical protein ASPVEDRAFT_60099 [Aspergillus versicolor CBS 583.65]